MAATDKAALRSGPLRIRVIYNPRAGRRRGRRFERVLGLLRGAGHMVEVVSTARAGDAAAFVRDAGPGKVDILAIAGGDGTVNDALQGAGERTPPIGLIPLGTANVLAHELGIGTAPHRIAACLTAGGIRRIQPGEVAGHRFMMMAGVGLDAQVVSTVSRAVKGRLGKAAYVAEVVRTLLRWPGAAFELRAGGVTFSAGSVIVSRGSRYGGRFVLAPKGDIFSQEFQLTRFPPGSSLSMFARFCSIPAGLLLRLQLADQQPVESLDILAPAGEPIQADGDIVGYTPARVTLCDQFIRFCVPCEETS